MERQLDTNGDGAAARRGPDGLSDLADGPEPALAALRELNRTLPATLKALDAERLAHSDSELRVALLQDANTALQLEVEDVTHRLDGVMLDLERSRETARRQRERAERLLHVVREMHQALYAGSTAEYVLRAAMQITHADAGVYVVMVGGRLRLRAAIDVPGDGIAPSPFIAEIAGRVLENGEELRWTSRGPDGIKAAADESIAGAGAAVPVSVRGEPHGVIIVFDKDGAFDDEDLDSLLAVGRQAGVAVENANLRREVHTAFVATIEMLADTVEAKDPYTQGHCREVSRLAARTAQILGLQDDDSRVTCYAALLHDVGKIGISDGVLNKPGTLLAEERQLVEAHVRIGHDLLNNIPALRDVASAVLYHHEWYDGNGYPEGLSGDAIPLASRIIAAVDAYCAMLDKRSYKEPMTPEAARAELRRASGTQFDPKVVDAVLVALDDPTEHDPEAAAVDCGVLPVRSTTHSPEATPTR